MSARIIFDGHIFRWQRVGGISGYFREIVKRLPAEFAPFVYGITAKNQLPDHPNLQWSSMSTLRPRRFSQPLKTAFWKHVSFARGSLLHPTYYPLSCGLGYSDFKCPVVITVHDFIAATYPDLEEDSSVILKWQREAIQRADHLICISRYTEQNLLERFPNKAGQTSVVYHGSSYPVISPQRLKADQSTKKRFQFLYVGRRSTYKNFEFLVRAFARACELDPDIRLVLAGPPLSIEERWTLHSLKIAARVESTVYPDEASLQKLYLESAALLYPSVHEGFGMPPLEAMSCGTLAVTSNLTSLPEVVDDAGIQLPADDSAVWVDCLLAISRGTLNRIPYLERGLRRASTLTWDESARRHVRAYKSLI